MLHKNGTGVRSGVFFLARRPEAACWTVAAILCAFYLAGSFLDFMPNLMWHDQQRIAQILALLAIGCTWAWSTIAFAGSRRWASPSWVRGCLMAAVALGAASATQAELPDRAFLELGLMTSLGVAVFLVADLREQCGRSFDRVLVATLVAISTAMLLRFIATYLGAFAAGGPIDTRELTALGFSNRRFLGQFLTLALPILAVPLSRASDQGMNRLAFPLLASCWMMVFASATRGTFLGVAIALTLALTLGPVARRWARNQVAGVLAGLCCYLLLFLVLPALAGVPVSLETRVENFASSSGRYELWAHSIAIAAQHPWLGIGPMHLSFEPPLGLPAHPHNSLIQIGAEWGTPALALIVLSSGFGLWQLARRTRDSNSPILAVLFASLSASLSQSLVDGVIVMPSTQFLLATIAGWALGACASRRAPLAKAKAPSLAVLFAVSLLVVGTYAMRDFPDLERRQDAYIAERGPYLHPRFWQQGLIGHPGHASPP